MNKLLVALAVFASFTCAALAELPGVKHVVLISVDGLAASYLNDPKAEMPNLRRIAAAGAQAQGMVTTFPSVTWPSHTSVITGATAVKHGVIGNGVIDRRTQKDLTYIGDPELTKDQSIRVPTIYDAVKAAGGKTASVIWPASNGAATLDWVIPDSNRPHLHKQYTTPGFADELASAGIDIAMLGPWGWGKQFSLVRDELYSNVTRHLIRKHQPNFIALHFITPDGVEHGYGPHTPEAYEAVKQTDVRVGEIWDALQKQFNGQATLFVVADHGFAHYDKNIQPNALFKSLGWVTLDAKNKPAQRRVWCKSQGGSAFIYIFDEAARPQLMQEAAAQLKKLEGVENVFIPEDFTRLGLPHPDTNPEAPHLIVATGPGYSFSDGYNGEVVVSSGGRKGTHGHLPTHAYCHAMFVAAGAGIQPGAKLGVIQNIDVAPTIARLMGVSLPTAEGRVLAEILAK